jgi:hypothetical protein
MPLSQVEQMIWAIVSLTCQNFVELQTLLTTCFALHFFFSLILKSEVICSSQMLADCQQTIPGNINLSSKLYQILITGFWRSNEVNEFYHFT